MAEPIDQRRGQTRSRAPAGVLDDRVSDMPMDREELATVIDGTLVQRRGKNIVVDFAPGMTSASRNDDKLHATNIVDKLDQSEQTRLCAKIQEQVAADIESRKDWQARSDQALELLGLRNRPLRELPFEGASAVTYPLLAEACVQFQARAIEEMFPSEGPVKTKIVGESTDDKVEQAERVADHMNYQMTEEDKAYFWNVDQMLFYLPLAGSTFKKTYFDAQQNMNVSRLVQAGDFIVPYTCTDLVTASRYTHRMRMVEGEMRRLMASGFYKDYELVETNEGFEDTQDDDAGREMRDEADDRQQSMDSEDFVYTLYEMHCDLVFDFDQKALDKDEKEAKVPLPYIVTVDTTSDELVSVRRNWKEEDETHQKRVWFTHYKYLPGLGFYGFGLLHLMGSVTEATTGTLRALLDSAAFANMQGGFVSSDAKVEPQDLHLAPGVYKQLKMTAEEMAKAFYTPPFKEPSPGLAQLFQTLLEAGRRFASITEEMVGDAPNTGPVGTTVALIEQGSKVFSGIHRRMHIAQAEEFALRAQLNYEFMDDEYPYEVEGASKVVYKDDYDGRVDVIPVSDPNIFSSTQRIAQSQAVLETADRYPGKVDLDKALERFFRALRIPDYEELLISSKATVRMDPVSENMKMMNGSGSKAFLEQDHEAHIQVHMMFLGGLNEEGLAVVEGAMRAHLGEHYSYKYFNQVNAQLGGQLPPPTFMDEQPEEDDELPIEYETLIAQAAAQIEPIQIMPPSEPEVDQEQVAFDNEERRKEESFLNDEDRKDRQSLGDARRKNEQTQGDEARKTTTTLQEENRKDESELRQQLREARLARQSDRRERRLGQDAQANT